MTVPGTNKYIEPLPSISFNGDEPVSAFKAWTLRENLQHIINSSTQYRINWCASKHLTSGSPSETIAHKSTDTDHRYWACEFPVAVHNPTEPVALDIRIGAFIEGSTTSVAVSADIVPHWYGKAVTGLPSADVLWSGSGSTTSTTGAVIIDEQATIPATAEPLYRSAVKIFTTSDATTRKPVVMPIMRLEMRVTGTFTGTGTGHVASVQVKEYVL